MSYKRRQTLTKSISAEPEKTPQQLCDRVTNEGWHFLSCLLPMLTNTLIKGQSSFQPHTQRPLLAQPVLIAAKNSQHAEPIMWCSPLAAYFTPLGCRAAVKILLPTRKWVEKCSNNYDQFKGRQQSLTCKETAPSHLNMSLMFSGHHRAQIKSKRPQTFSK